MNVLAALRDLMASPLEGRRMEMLGPDYKQRRAKQALDMERLRETILTERDTRGRAGRSEANEIQKLILDSMKNREVGDNPTVEFAGPEGPVAVPTADRSDLVGQLKEELGIRGTAATTQAVDQARQIGALPPTESDKFSAAEAFKRTKYSSDAMASRANSLLMPNSPETDAAVANAASRVASGELTIDQARGLLGGVRGGQGPALIRALANSRVIPPKVRQDLVGVQTTRNIVDKMAEMVDVIVNATTDRERVEATLMLEQFGQTTGTLLARGFGERGVVTDRDVARVTGLVPGWKAANFAPAYAKRELAALYDVLDRNERGITEGYFQTQDRTGGPTVPGAAAGTRLRYNPATGNLDPVQ